MDLSNNYKVLIKKRSEKIWIVLKSMIVGLFVSVVVVSYRVAVRYAEEFSFFAYEKLKNNYEFIPAFLVLLLIAGYITGKLVSSNKMISGSGIPQIEGILKGYFRNRKPWTHTLLAKFVGGVLAIGAGLSLGREGPSIQLGASIAEGIGRKIGKGRLERKILIASGASAGLSAAFNAPMAGVIFSLEEIFKYFSPTILLSLMSAAVVSDFVSKQIFGMSPVFGFEITQTLALNDYWLLILLGILLGVLGVAYNYVLLKTKKLYSSIQTIPVQIKVMIPFIVAAIMGFVFPVVLGGGHRIVEELTIQNTIYFLIIVFVIKFLFSMISFGSGAPGGIFFPLIILGALIGAIFGKFVILFGYDPKLLNYFIILAMAGYLTAIVRAPITGIVLVMEMTGSFHNMLPLTIVSITAYVIADLLKSPPIYEALLEQIIDNEKTAEKIVPHNKKVLVEMIVQHGSKLANRKVRNIKWPSKTLLVEVKQGENHVTPQGDTIIYEGDYLTILTDVNHEHRVKALMTEMNEADQ